MKSYISEDLFKNLIVHYISPFKYYKVAPTSKLLNNIIDEHRLKQINKYYPENEIGDE